jgi:hypothetical protein
MTRMAEDTFYNPIDPDKVTDRPGLIPYPHHIGSPAFAPTQSGTIRSSAIKAMQEQSSMQLDQIKEQIALLARQAEAIQHRIEVSKAVYSAEMSFQPVIGKTYHLYAREEGAFVLSMVGPSEWGRIIPFRYFVASVKLLSDHTWSVEEQGAG